MKSILSGITIALTFLFSPSAANAALIAVEYGQDSPVYSVSTVDGSLTYIGLSGFAGLNSLAKDSSDTIYSVGTKKGAESPWLITIDPHSGRGNPLTEIAFGDFRGDVKALAFSPGDVLFASVGQTDVEHTAGFGFHDLYTIDTTTGRGSYVGPLAGAYLGLAFGGDGTLFGWEATEGLATIDTLSGAATDVNPAATGRAGSLYGGLHLQTIAFSPGGTLYGDTQFELFTIDTDTGIPSSVGAPRESDIRGMEFVGRMSVPEPPAAVIVTPFIAIFLLLRRILPERSGRGATSRALSDHLPPASSSPAKDS